jgi:hypothetical protein
MQVLKNKMYQKTRRNRPKEKSNFICSSRWKNSKIILVWHSSNLFRFRQVLGKSVQIAEKNLEKDTGIPKTQQKATKTEDK